MGTNTTKLALFKPASTDTVDNAVDLNNNWDKIDTQLPFQIVTSTTRPTGGNLYAGQKIYETDTGLYVVYDGTNWQYSTVNAISPVDSAVAGTFKAHSAGQSVNILNVVDFDNTLLFGISRDGNRVGKTGNLPFATAGGLANAVWSGTTTSTTNITFPTNRFTQPPLVFAVMAPASGAVANAYCSFQIARNTVTTSGAQIIALAGATLTATIQLSWWAFQMTANSATG